MSANYWASTQCNNWLIDRAQLELARHEDRDYSAVEPFLVCATCVYVAAKVEESPIHIKSAVAEAARSFQEVGFRAMPTDNSSLAEMEFYLLEEMEFDMILFHPYRSLLAIYDAHGSDSSDTTATSSATAALGIEAEAFGVRGLESIETRSEARLAELDQHVLQMSWLVLNDAYRSNLPLLYPPYMLALAAVWIALTLHTTAYERINATLESMQQHRQKTPAGRAGGDRASERRGAHLLCQPQRVAPAAGRGGGRACSRRTSANRRRPNSSPTVRAWSSCSNACATHAEPHCSPPTHRGASIQ
ncbi:hypothetical protein L1887_51413 [Cichorium endivia]|nr:hypothetical protein L1887_51413 [Cichorium endivia]